MAMEINVEDMDVQSYRIIIHRNTKTAVVSKEVKQQTKPYEGVGRG